MVGPPPIPFLILFLLGLAVLLSHKIAADFHSVFYCLSNAGPTAQNELLSVTQVASLATTHNFLQGPENSFFKTCNVRPQECNQASSTNYTGDIIFGIMGPGSQHSQ